MDDDFDYDTLFSIYDWKLLLKPDATALTVNSEGVFELTPVAAIQRAHHLEMEAGRALNFFEEIMRGCRLVNANYKGDEWNTKINGIPK